MLQPALGPPCGRKMGNILELGAPRLTSPHWTGILEERSTMELGFGDPGKIVSLLEPQQLSSACKNEQPRVALVSRRALLSQAKHGYAVCWLTCLSKELISISHRK